MRFLQNLEVTLAAVTEVVAEMERGGWNLDIL